MGEEVGLQPRLRREHPLDRHLSDRRTGRRHPQPRGAVPADPRRDLGRGHLVGRTTLQDCPAEQPLRAGHGEQHADAHRTGRLTEDGDVGGVAAERGDVLLHPLQGGDLVEQTQVGVAVAVAEVEEALGTETIVQGHA